jgi:hypothetical protein
MRLGSVSSWTLRVMTLPEKIGTVGEIHWTVDDCKEKLHALATDCLFS